MTLRAECEIARRSLCELAGPGDASPRPVDAAMARHLLDCSSCARELRLLRGAVDATVELSRVEVPEPPDGYWETFLPSVRSRIHRDARRHVARPSRRAHGMPAVAAAAAIIIAAAAGSLLLPPLRPSAGNPLAEAGHRMETAMRAQPALSGELAADLIGSDPMPGIGAREILDAMKEIESPPSLAGTWAGVEDDELQRLLDGLDARRVIEVRAELAASPG